MNRLFFELIRVAVGNAVCLSHTPKTKDWALLFDMAKKQSLVGVCFASVQKLQAQRQAPNSWGSPEGEMMYLQWMGMAAKVQHRNETLNRQCAALGERLKALGYRSCVLKGQGVASLYEANLGVLRQPGDIDIWVEGDRDVVLDAIRKSGVDVSCVDSVHAHASFYNDTEVETHFRPSWMYSSKGDKAFREFWESSKEDQFAHHDEVLGFAYPTVVFNLVYSMLHINRHIFEEGIGMRQLMDYYFIVKASTADERKDAMDVLRKMGLARFVGGIMYIEHVVFGLADGLLLCAADRKEGEFLLEDIVKGGNFGKYDERTEVYALNERWKRGWFTLKHNVKYLWHYPDETLAIPFWKIKHYLWRKKKGYI